MRGQGHGRGQLDRDHGEGGTREGTGEDAGAWEGKWELEGAGSWEGTAQQEPLRSMSKPRDRNQGGLRGLGGCMSLRGYMRMGGTGAW